AHLLLQVARLLRLVEGVVELLLGLVQRAQKALFGRRQAKVGHLLLQIRRFASRGGRPVFRSGRGGHGGIRGAASHAAKRSKTLASSEPHASPPPPQRRQRTPCGPFPRLAHATPSRLRSRSRLPRRDRKRPRVTHQVT